MPKGLSFILNPNPGTEKAPGVNRVKQMDQAGMWYTTEKT